MPPISYSIQISFIIIYNVNDRLYDCRFGIKEFFTQIIHDECSNVFSTTHKRKLSQDYKLTSYNYVIIAQIMYYKKFIFIDSNNTQPSYRANHFLVFPCMTIYQFVSKYHYNDRDCNSHTDLEVKEMLVIFRG